MKQQIGVLVSGGGSNLQALIDAGERGAIPAGIGVVISNKPGVYALERAARHGIPTRVVNHQDYDSVTEFTRAILAVLQEFNIGLVCLAGFLRILDPVFFETFTDRVLNIHPSLLPAFGGKGMYGHHVHEAVLQSGAKYSGATVHIVTAEPDVGPIVAQGIVEVTDADTADTLAARVLQVEHRIYPEAVALMLNGGMQIDGLRVKRKP